MSQSIIQKGKKSQTNKTLEMEPATRLVFFLWQSPAQHTSITGELHNKLKYSQSVPGKGRNYQQPACVFVQENNKGMSAIQHAVSVINKLNMPLILQQKDKHKTLQFKYSKTELIGNASLSDRRRGFFPCKKPSKTHFITVFLLVVIEIRANPKIY